MSDDLKLESFELSEEDFERLEALLDTNATDDEIAAFWDEVGRRMGFYPTTVTLTRPDPTLHFFVARPLNRYTSIDDIAAGWSFDDWLVGWGPGETWRFQLSRKLTPLESRRVQTRLNQNETWDQESGTYGLNATLELIRRLSGDDLYLTKCRIDHVDCEIKDGWEPILPEPQDVEIKIDQRSNS